MASSAERQKVYRRLMKEKGLVPVTVYVPERLAGDYMLVAKQLIDNPELEVAMFRNVRTGRLKKI